MIRIDTTYASPYLAGVGIGVLSWIAFATAKKPLGVSTAFESTAAALQQTLAPRLSRVNEYLAQRDEVPTIDWEWALVAGIPIGSYLSARFDHGYRPRGESVPLLWQSRFGANSSRRYAGAFVGGALMMFGARMAKGCTSGHAISGNLQLAASSWLFSAVFATSALALARALFGGKP